LRPSPAQALDFNLVYRGPGSGQADARATTNPSDPTGALLIAHMQEASSEWADLIEDNHTMTINFFYAGATEVPTQTANARTLTSVDANPDGSEENRTVLGEMKFFDGASTWFFDPTPQSDAEFNMEQIVLSDLSPADQAAGFNVGPGSAPQLEIGYRSSNSVAGTDLLSTARHEIGHLMGVTSSFDLPAVGIETSDGDYDFDPSFVGGVPVGAIVADDNGMQVDFHLEAAPPLMSNVGSLAGSRRDISAADVFAAASVGAWTQIDLKRVNYLRTSNTNFATAANWLGNRVPDPTDDVAIKHGGNVNLTANDIVKTLDVGENSSLSTGAFSLIVQGDAKISPTSGAGTARLTIPTGGVFSSRDLSVDDAVVTLEGGIVSAAQRSISNEGTIEGHGTIRYDVQFSNRRTLEASGGTLVIEEAISGSGGTINLGPLGSSAIVRAVTGSLDINTRLVNGSPTTPSSFSGTMTIGAGRFIEVNEALRLQSGAITLDGSGAQAATFRGPLLVINDVLIADRLATIDAATEITSAGSMQVPQANDTLTVANNLLLAGGDITGNGTLITNKALDASFGTIAVGELELQGDTTIQNATVNVPIIEAAGVRLVQDGGTLSFGKLTGVLTQTDGVVEIDDSQITGSLEQTSDAELAFEIGGIGSGDFSQLTITQNAELAGDIRVTLTGGFDPAPGQIFPIVLAGNMDVDSLNLVGPAANRFDLELDGDALILEALAAGLSGDYNNDGMVDAVDYALWRENLGAPAGTLPNDTAGGAIGTAQYNLWRTNYGATTGNATGQATPEPTALLLMMLAGATLLGGGRKSTERVFC